MWLFLQRKLAVSVLKVLFLGFMFTALLLLVNIGKNAVIGKRAVIKECAVILPDAVLAPDTVVPPFAIFGGAPARPVGKVPDNHQEAITELTTTFYQNTKVEDFGKGKWNTQLPKFQKENTSQALHLVCKITFTVTLYSSHVKLTLLSFKIKIDVFHQDFLFRKKCWEPHQSQLEPSLLLALTTPK